MILRIDLKLLGRRKLKRPIVNIRPSYAIKNGLIKFSNKRVALMVLYKYGKAIAKHLQNGEIYKIVYADSAYVGISGVQISRNKRSVTDIMNVMGDRFDVSKYVLQPRIKVSIVCGISGNMKFVIKQEKGIRMLLNKLPVVQLNKFPKE